jgi:plasmid stabilization system protein ParE
VSPTVKSTLFEADFERIALYLCDVNPDAALRFVEAVEAGIELLREHPEIGPLWRYGNPQHPTRFLLVPGFKGRVSFLR